METPGLFVYGSLLSGPVGGGLLKALPRSPATMPGRLWRLPSGAVVLVEDRAPLAIRGDYLELPDPGMWRVLDLTEGVAQGPVQRAMGSATVGGSPRPAWVYRCTEVEVRRAGGVRLRGADWRRLGGRGD